MIRLNVGDQLSCVFVFFDPTYLSDGQAVRVNASFARRDDKVTLAYVSVAVGANEFAHSVGKEAVIAFENPVDRASGTDRACRRVVTDNAPHFGII